MSTESAAAGEARHIFALGPEGTFSDQAARRVRDALAGSSGKGVPIRYSHTIPEVLRSVEADPEAWGVIPLENSVAGTIGQAQDGLMLHRVTIVRELSVRVRYALVANVPLAEADVVYAHPQAVDQCSEYLAANLPQAEVEFSHSNMDSSAQFRASAAHEPPLPVAAIVPIEFGRANPQWLAASDIQTYPNNLTRFLVVRRSREPEQFDFTRRKTTVCIAPRAEEGHEDRPGLLYELLSIFYKHRVNLARLESRPNKSRPWAYVFFIDFTNNPNSEACLAELRKTSATVTVLGSYDQLE
jgi:chorismate mutase/prephenate dehydratase